MLHIKCEGEYTIFSLARQEVVLGIICAFPPRSQVLQKTQGLPLEEVLLHLQKHYQRSLV